MSSSDEKSIAEKVPVEIISHILQHLPISDLRSAKLVNSKWYHASQDLAIQKRQKFILNGLFYKSRIGLAFDVLEIGGFQYYNLEFHNQNFGVCLNEFLTFIDNNSPYIHLLRFLKCSVPFVLFDKIMIACINLEKLIFKNCFCPDFTETNSLMSSKTKVVQEKLSYLELNPCADWCDKSLFELFLNVYPNIKRLRSERFSVKFTENPLPEIPFFLCESMGDCLYGDFFLELATRPWITLEKLKLRDMYYNYRAHSRSDYENALPNRSDLKDLNIWNCSRTRIESLEAVLHLFRNLERLNISHPFQDYIEESRLKEMLKLLAQSKLKVLEFKCFTWFYSTPFPNSYRNRNTHYLNLERLCERNGVLFVVPMLKTFCELTYLDCSSVEVGSLKKDAARIIFQDQSKLKYLKLNCCNWISDRAFKKNNMRNLEHLELAKTRITEAAIRYFDFPKLKFICIRGCWALSEKGMALLPVKCPLLQYIDLRDTRVVETTVLDICKNLKFLHCLRIAARHRNKRNPLVSINMKTVSEYCPSLRFIEMGKRVPHFEEDVGYYIGMKGDVFAYNCLEKVWDKCIKNRPKCSRCFPWRRRLKQLNL